MPATTRKPVRPAAAGGSGRSEHECSCPVHGLEAIARAMAEALRPRRRVHLLARLVMLAVLLFGVTAQPAMAQSILRDAETELLLKDMSKPLIEAAGLSPRNVEIVLIHDKSINAFVAGGQIVYVHSGLFTAAANANEVQGVIAHELGHITGGHVLRFEEGVKMATGIMI